MKYLGYTFILFICCLGIMLGGCGKDGGKCVSSTGRILLQDRNISDFDSIRVLDHVNVILNQGSENKVMVEAGEFIIGGIVTELAGRELVLRNTNRCNWLRSYSKPINVYVTVKNLLKIHYDSSGDITCTDTLRSGYLKIDMWGGCGAIDLKINVSDGFFIQHIGTATLILTGICKISNVFAGDYGLLQLTGLKAGYTFVTNSGTNNCYVYANRELDATITSIGNIYYSGDPKEIKATITGSGKLLPY
ncbi:MAG: head GIN domain-containing protein [Bacteroidales bacterium]|nr:head GIN domain-containing protein [Bacteroidales bacterium]